MITLIKYKNRKLYDRVFNRYVTSLDVAGLLRDTISVKVKHYATSEDITKQSLTNMGALQIRLGNLEDGHLLTSYADTYKGD